jgi:D-aspartate ligase
LAKDARDGIFKILDCNPRVGQNFRKNSAEIDVVRARYLDLTGQHLGCAPMVEGRMFTVESFYLLALMRPSRCRALNPDGGTYPRSGGRELTWWSSDNWLPFFLMGVRLFAQVLKRVFRRLANLAVPKRRAITSHI